MSGLGSSQREETVVKSYTALTQNMFKHLARGEEVQYGAFRVKTVDGKIIVRGVLQDGREMELHYRLRQGKEAGLARRHRSKEREGRVMHGGLDPPQRYARATLLRMPWHFW